MKRLTKYEPSGSMYPYKLKDNEWITEKDSIHKLGMLENIEEELGIDLFILFKAFKEGIWVGGKNEYGLTLETEFWEPKTFEIKYHKYIGICFSKITGGNAYSKTEDNFGFSLSYSVVELKDYGKTWALIKEGLEQ